MMSNFLMIRILYSLSDFVKGNVSQCKRLNLDEEQ